MLKAFFKKRKWIAWAWGGGAVIVASILVQVWLSTCINTWYGGMYSHLQEAKKFMGNPDEGTRILMGYLIQFAYIALPYIAIATFTNWIASLWALRWRSAIFDDFLPLWKASEITIESSAQRLQSDIYRFTKKVEYLGMSILRAVMTLVAFLPILWGLSKYVTIPVLCDIPGSLVWVALSCSIGGLGGAWLVGIKLPKLEKVNASVEADLRKELVLAEDDKLAYAQPETIFNLFTGVRINYQKLFAHQSYLNFWLNCFEQVMVITPYVVASAGLFTGTMTLGVLIQVSNAFGKVQHSMSLFTSNWASITEFRSIIQRLKEFKETIT